MISITVNVTGIDGHAVALTPDGDNVIVSASDGRGKMSGVVRLTDLAQAVRTLLGAQLDPAERDAVRTSLNDDRPPMVELPPTTEPWRIARATRDVARNLNRSADDRHSETKGAALARGTRREFMDSAKRWLKDQTELSGKTIDHADYDVLYDEFLEPEGGA